MEDNSKYEKMEYEHMGENAMLVYYDEYSSYIDTVYVHVYRVKSEYPYTDTFRYIKCDEFICNKRDEKTITCHRPNHVCRKKDLDLIFDGFNGSGAYSCKISDETYEYLYKLFQEDTNGVFEYAGKCVEGVLEQGNH